jgi:hypothetical protein
MTDVDVLPSDTSWLFEPTTGVHQFGGGSAIPDYVEHCEGATEIGKLSAEAVVREYESAAKEIEGMGAELIERVKQCEAMTRDALVVTEEMKETAARYREEAERIFLQIEDCTLITAEVRKTCTELKEKIAAPAS